MGQQVALTSYSKHIQPTPMLQHPNKTNNTNHSKRDDRKLLRELVHAQLERRSAFFDLRTYKGPRDHRNNVKIRYVYMNTTDKDGELNDFKCTDSHPASS